VGAPGRELGLAGVRRGKAKRTTLPNLAAARPADLVERGFTAERPDQLWVCDLTYIRTWVGSATWRWSSTCSAAGSSAGQSLGTCAPSCRWRRSNWRSGPASSIRWTGWVHHTDAGSQGGFNWLSQHLDLEVCGWDSHGVGQRQRQEGSDAVAGATAGCPA
jgi:putative transposase